MKEKQNNKDVTYYIKSSNSNIEHNIALRDIEGNKEYSILYKGNANKCPIEYKKNRFKGILNRSKYAIVYTSKCSIDSNIDYAWYPDTCLSSTQGKRKDQVIDSEMFIMISGVLLVVLLIALGSGILGI